MFLKQCVRLLIVGVMVSLVQGCFQSGSAEDGLILKDHPLAGKIWDVKRQRFITEPLLEQSLRNSDYLLLGETHDNIRHHQYQARILAALSSLQRPVRVYFEMIDDEQGRLLDDSDLDSAGQLLEILEQQDPGWDYGAMYRVVFEQAWKSGFDIRAANLSRDRVLEVMKQGEQAVPETLRKRMEDTPLDREQLAAMEQEVIEAHCNIMPDDMIKPMILGQRVRDVAMASALAQDDDQRAMKVLVTGSGHARRDRGIPLYLQSTLADGASIVSLGMMEVIEGEQAPPGYMECCDGTLPFDYVWFTVRFDRPDPCEALQKRMDNRS